MSISLNEKNILVSAIGLRYWELTEDTYDQRQNSRELTNNLLKEITPKETLVDDGVTKDNVIALSGFLRHLNNTDEAQNYTMTKQTLRGIIRNDEELWDAAKLAINKDLTKDEVEAYKIACISHINQYFLQHEFFTRVKKYLTRMFYNENRNGSIQEIASELIGILTPYSNTGTSDGGIGIDNPKAVASFSTSRSESIEKVWEHGQEKSSPEGILKTGYQGINRALGAPGGFFRGDTVLIGALQHNYKSGSLNDFLSDICHYNKPHCYKEGRQGAIVHVSLENGAEDDLNRIYKRAFYSLYGKYPTLEDLLNTDPKQVARVIEEYTCKNGFTYHYLRLNPSNVSYMDIQKLVIEFETQGYEIHVLGIDYLSMMNTTGISSKGDGTEYQELFRVMRNFCSERNITLMTPHQLSTEATYLNRDGYEADFVTKVAGKSYWAKSKQIDREVDVEIVQHIIHCKDDMGRDKAYLTYCVGKNRRVHDTPVSHKSGALPFTEYGLIADLEKNPTFISDLKRLRGGGHVDEDMFA